MTLQIDDLSVDYVSGRDTIHATRGVSLTVEPGEIVAVVGESGSGKSTTAHSVLGLLPESARVVGGSARFEGGQELLGLPDRKLRHIRGRRIGFIPQDPMLALNPVSRIGDQIAEVVRIHKLADRRGASLRAIDALETAGLDQPAVRARQYPHELSGGMRQRALIAIAMVAEPSLLVADEPTSALDVTVQRVILDRITLLSDQFGTGVLLITHDLGVAAERAHRVIVMKDGAIVESGHAVDILDHPEDPYTRELIKVAPSLNSVPLITGRPEPATDVDEPLLRVTGLIKDFPLPRTATARSFRAVDDVSFEVHPGETFGLVGESGSGKSTTARLAVRLLEPTAGTVIFEGEDITAARGEQLRLLRRRFQFVYQNPFASLDPRLSVAASISEPLDAFGIGSRNERRQRARELLDRVALPLSVLDRKPVELSGGQRQRVAIARALALRPDLVVCDEPVSALDVSVQARILELLVSLQDELGVSYVFISHDLAVVRQIAHRVGVMRGGVLVETGTAEDIFARPRSDYTRALLDAIPHPDKEIHV